MDGITAVSEKLEEGGMSLLDGITAVVSEKLEEGVMRLLPSILLRRWRKLWWKSRIIRSRCWWKKLCWMDGITAGEKSEEGVRSPGEFHICVESPGELRICVGKVPVSFTSAWNFISVWKVSVNFVSAWEKSR